MTMKPHLNMDWLWYYWRLHGGGAHYVLFFFLKSYSFASLFGLVASLFPVEPLLLPPPCIFSHPEHPPFRVLQAEAERLELLELRLRREAREAAASGGESSEAALRLAARVAELEAEVADLEATRQEERRAAQAEHAKLMDAKREIGDLKRLLKVRKGVKKKTHTQKLHPPFFFC